MFLQRKKTFPSRLFSYPCFANLTDNRVILARVHDHDRPFPLKSFNFLKWHSNRYTKGKTQKQNI